MTETEINAELVATFERRAMLQQQGQAIANEIQQLDQRQGYLATRLQILREDKAAKTEKPKK